MTHNFCDATIKQSGIYKITRPNGVVVYVGSAFSFIKRFHCHRAQLRGGYHHSIVLQRIYKKHGEEHLKMSLLEVVDIEELPKKEVEYIAEIRPMANSSKEYKASMLGRRHSEETKRKISDAQKGRKPNPLNEEQRIKLSMALKGKKKSEKGRENMSKAKTGSKNPMYGMKAINRKMVTSSFEDGSVVQYESLIDAQKATGVDYRNIQAICAGKRKRGNGIKFSYA